MPDVNKHLEKVDGVMVGRAIYHDPYLLSGVDKTIFGQRGGSLSRHEVVLAMLPYIEQRMTAGRSLKSITRHMLGLFQGQPGAKAWRRYLSERVHLTGANINVVEQALALVPDTSAFAK